MWIHYPIFALVLLFLWLWLATASLRITAVKRGELSLKAVNYVLKDEMNNRTRLYGNSYDNQYQQPILFICLLALLHIESIAGIGWYILALIFVVSRYWHCYEHIRSTNIRKRTVAFALSSLSLFGGWIAWFALMSIS
ncbi:MAPEG family protein [Pseudoalteromonas luteoviolacea]|uniref:MAPEG family protein n=1 Tax=Pseudoalteromonas luteoviolacea TaxID=43657 RepID=UPI001B381EF5|nr:MAPEG family protein [Pseudoalteromonas luteoviolacea]MBQ4834760.1 MAPEG family protein [Pseudoalteromonas luteoviolacea]